MVGRDDARDGCDSAWCCFALARSGAGAYIMERKQRACLGEAQNRPGSSSSSPQQEIPDCSVGCNDQPRWGVGEGKVVGVGEWTQVQQRLLRGTKRA